MKMFWIRYGLGGGFGGPGAWESTLAKDLDDAETQAWEAACEKYDTFDGLYGLQTIGEIKEEDPELTEGDAEEQWRESRESWLDYQATDKKPEGY